MNLDMTVGILRTALLAGGVPALAALGEVMAERVGVINLGIEGLMSMGAVTAAAIAIATSNPYLGVLGALGAGFALGMLFGAVTVYVRANQVLCGLALTLIGTGLAQSLGKPYSGVPVPVMLGVLHVPLLSRIPLVGEALFSQNLLVYVTYLLLPLGLHQLLFRTRHGLNLRAVGENPAAADAVGIPVRRIRFCYVALGSALAGAAGAYLTLGFVPSWSDGVVAGRGWIALALVIFAGYRPVTVVLAALLFGAVTALGFIGQARNWPIAPAVLSMLPYLATLVLLIAPAVVAPGLRRRMAAPAALGLPYFREER
jgi:simple sugar transport system permease protein